MSLTSYRTAPPRGGGGMFRLSHRSSRATFFQSVLIRFGGDLLSHVLRRSTIGATGLIVRVRDGIGSLPRAMTTKPGKNRSFLISRSLSKNRKATFWAALRHISGTVRPLWPLMLHELVFPALSLVAFRIWQGGFPRYRIASSQLGD